MLTLAHGLSETHTVHIAMTQFADEVAEKTDGRIQVKIFPNGQLGSENENLEQLQAGVIAMTKVSAPGLATYNDAFNTFGLPYIFNDTDDFYHVMDSQEMQDFFLSTGDDGFVTLTYYTSGARSFYTKDRAIRTPADLKGLKIRVQDMKSQTDMMMNKALFIPNGNWMEGEMADAPRADGFEFGLTCAPVLDDGETRYVMSSVEQFEIPANAKNPELAKEFLRFLYTEDSVKLFAEKANGIYALKKANEMVKGIVTDGVYNMNDIYQEGTFMVFGWDAMPDTSKVVIADSVFNVASDVMNGDMTAEQWRDGIEAAFEEIAASK